MDVYLRAHASICVCSLFNGISNDYIALNYWIKVNNKLESQWKETIVS
jgi:hypothetical protein